MVKTKYIFCLIISYKNLWSGDQNWWGDQNWLGTKIGQRTKIGRGTKIGLGNKIGLETKIGRGPKNQYKCIKFTVEILKIQWFWFNHTILLRDKNFRKWPNNVSNQQSRRLRQLYKVYCWDFRNPMILVKPHNCASYETFEFKQIIVKTFKT